MSKKEAIEHRVLKIVRSSQKPPTPQEVEKQIGGNSTVRDAIVSLVDKGKLQVTLNWKLRVNE